MKSNIETPDHRQSSGQLLMVHVPKHLSGTMLKVTDCWQVIASMRASCLLVAAAMMLLLLRLDAPVHAQVISLDSVLIRIDSRNPELLEYDHRLQALSSYAEGGRSWMAPMVGIGTFMTPYPGQEIMNAAGKGSIMISLEQSIPNPAKLNAKKRFLDSKAAVETQARKDQFNTLRAETKFIYYQSQVLARKLKVLHENQLILELMLKLARIRYPYNQGTLGNIYRTEGRKHEIENMIVMTEAGSEGNAYRLKSLMNVAMDSNFAMDTTLHIREEPIPLIYDTTAIHASRSDLQKLDRTIDVMRLNQQLQRAQAKPDFKIQFNHMQPLGNMPAMFTTMAMISIPIAPWSSRMYKSEVKGMDADIEAMKRAREAMLINTSGMLSRMATQINSLQQQLKNYDSRIIPALRKNYQTLMLAYEENREQLPMVVDGWEALNMAQLEYLDKMEEYFSMIVRYEKELEE